MRRANTGPYATEEEALGAVVKRLVLALQPRAVYLFGSRAEGRARPDSAHERTAAFLARQYVARQRQ